MGRWRKSGAKGRWDRGFEFASYRCCYYRWFGCRAKSAGTRSGQERNYQLGTECTMESCWKRSYWDRKIIVRARSWCKSHQQKDALSYFWTQFHVSSAPCFDCSLDCCWERSLKCCAVPCGARCWYGEGWQWWRHAPNLGYLQRSLRSGSILAGAGGEQRQGRQWRSRSPPRCCVPRSSRNCQAAHGLWGGVECGELRRSSTDRLY